MKITVNVIAPGLTDTELLRTTHSDSDIRSIEGTVPLGICSLDDIGAAAVYLASRAAQHVTGITLDVNGGRLLGKIGRPDFSVWRDGKGPVFLCF
jgi:3-oxoacyl-[acyl-carrier protein] reductase